jgi:hypothetical protein
MKDSPRQNFRWAPHTSGVTLVKLKDYEEAGNVDAVNPYEAWEQLKGTDAALQVGDILENEIGEIRLFKYVGFEEAKWVVAEQGPAVPVKM